MDFTQIRGKLKKLIAGNMILTQDLHPDRTYYSSAFANFKYIESYANRSNTKPINVYV